MQYSTDYIYPKDFKKEPTYQHDFWNLGTVFGMKSNHQQKIVFSTTNVRQYN